VRAATVTALVAAAIVADPASAQALPVAGAPQAATEACFGQPGPCPVAPGVTYRQIVRTVPRPMVIHVAEVDLSAPGVRVSVTPGDRSAGMEYRATETSRFVTRSGAVLAVNASYFLPFIGGTKGGGDFVPQPGSAADASGGVVSGGITVSPPDAVDARVDSIACFAAGKAVIAAGQVCPPGMTDGVSAGPRLLTGGAAVPRPNVGGDSAFHGAVPQQAAPPGAASGRGGPRTALGVDGAGTRLWLVVVDGRQAGYSEGASHDDLIALFRDLGATDAMSLDGGGSATMAARGRFGAVVLNRPIHTGVPGRERPVANHVAVFSDAAGAPPRGGAGLLPPLVKVEVQQLEAKLERIYQAPEARQGVAVDDRYFYAIVNTAIGKYERDSGRLVARWAGPRDGAIRHLNSCTIHRAELVCAHSNHPQVPMGSSIEVWDPATMTHKRSHSLGNMDEGSLTIVEPMSSGWLLGFAHYSDETGVPFKSSDYSQLIATDDGWRRTGGWLIPAAIRKRMAPQAASGGAIGTDGMLYLFGHTLPELYVLAKPSMGVELVHVATIAIDAGGQAFAFDPNDSRRMFAIDRETATVRVFRLPDIVPPTGLTARFERPVSIAARRP